MIRQLFLLSTIIGCGAFIVAPRVTTWKPLVSPFQLHSDAGSADADEPSTTDGGDGSSSSSEEEPHAEAALPSEEQADILNSPAFLKRKVEVLQSDIKSLEGDIEEANAQYLAGKEEWGTKFDMLIKESQGMQARLVNQTSQVDVKATVDIATKMLNVLDNYDRAFQSIEATTNEEVEIVDAYKTTYDMILGAFAELNVTKVETVGSEFDYELHQAMMTMPSDEYEEGIVCQEFAMGWRCGETLVRPAMVAVTG